MAANLPKALPESCLGSTLRHGKRGPGCPALRGPTAGARAVPQPRMALLEDAPAGAGAALDADSRCCISKARSRRARCRLGSSYLAGQSSASLCPGPPPANPSQRGAARTPRSWSLCPEDAGTPSAWGTVPAGAGGSRRLHIARSSAPTLCGALVWGSGSSEPWAEERPGVAAVGFEH